MQAQRIHPMHELFTLRMYGDNVTLMRCAWLDLLDDLRPDSELAWRIFERLEMTA